MALQNSMKLTQEKRGIRQREPAVATYGRETERVYSFDSIANMMMGSAAWTVRLSRVSYTTVSQSIFGDYCQYEIFTGQMSFLSSNQQRQSTEEMPENNVTKT